MMNPQLRLMTRACLRFLCALFLMLSACYHPKPVKVLKGAEAVHPRTLFLALDGVDWTLMNELWQEGHFRSFAKPIPLVSTFPSDTTIGFTGLFWPLAVGKVPGYESRFYSKKENRIMGGTPLDIYKIDINYKNYFDTFRHTMQEKVVMYSTPGAAGKADLINIEKMLSQNDKRVVFAYVGSTDGAAHTLGRLRTKRFLIFMDQYLQRMVRRYREKTGEDLRIVMFADHGFAYHRLKSVDLGEMKRRLAVKGYSFNSRLVGPKDVVSVKFGLLSAGVFFMQPEARADVGRIMAGIKGIDIVAWHDGKKTIHILNHAGAAARFEYQSGKRFRYLTDAGDPLGYAPLLVQNGYHVGQFLSADEWFKISSHAKYPDAGYRLYDSFFRLVENPADVIISTLPDYQYGALVTRVATYPKFGQRGTHGGLFRQTTWTFAMESLSHAQADQPSALRYDQFFEHFLKPVVRQYRREPILDAKLP